MFIWQHIILPLLAIVALGVADHHVKKGLSEWLVNLGWDTCVLALGAAPAVFLSDSADLLCGGQLVAACWGFAFVLSTITLAGFVVGKLRSIESKHVGHAFSALLIGGALLEGVWEVPRSVLKCVYGIPERPQRHGMADHCTSAAGIEARRSATRNRAPSGGQRHLLRPA